MEKMQQAARDFLSLGGWDVHPDNVNTAWKAARKNWTRAISEATEEEIYTALDAARK